jgi:hypothetical protein
MLVRRPHRAVSSPARFILVLALLVLVAAPAFAGSVTVTWDRNAEPDVVGYRVFWGTQSGVYTISQAVGNLTTWTVNDLAPGATYYFAVQAVSADGLTSPLSQEVSTTIPALPPTGETEAAWKARFGIVDMAGDADGDGVINRDEYLNGTDPTIPNTWLLAEGASGFFKARFAIMNPGTDQAEITVKFLREGLGPITRQYSVPGKSRTTINSTDIDGLSYISFSTEVTAQRGGVLVERTMTWGGADKLDSAHTGKAVSGPQPDWYFAEGDARTFDTYLLLANANAAPATVDVTYLLDSGGTVQETYVVAANARRTIYTNNVRGLLNTTFSMTVHASAPINAERAMYLTVADAYYKCGTDSNGIEAPSTQWFIAEGHTGAMFSEYILLANPNPSTATATIRYLRPSGPVITQSYSLRPNSRTTIYVNEIPGLEYTDVSASITATQPIVAERSMYWPGQWGQWYEGHNSTALSAIGTSWALAEGETGGTRNAISYILMANPTEQDATVTVTILRDNNLPPLVVAKIVKANSRLTLTSTDLALASGETFGALIDSTNGVPIAVERAMYWDSATKHWSAGTNETGFLLK